MLLVHCLPQQLITGGGMRQKEGNLTLIVHIMDGLSGWPLEDSMTE